MSDRDVTTRATTLPVTYRAARPAPVYRAARPTVYQRQPVNVPYVSLPDDKNERRTMWEAIVDRLSTFQYMGANLAEDLFVHGKGPGQWDDPLGKGWTGERKGDWTNVLFGGPGTAEDAGDLPGVIPIDPETAGTGGKIARGAGGFLANVLLDPTTYVGFGATAAGKAGARQFATLAANQAMRQMADPAVTAKVFGARVMRKNIPYEKRVEKIGAAAQAQHRARVYREAYKEALTSSPEELRNKYIGRLTREKDEANDLLRSLKGNNADWARIQATESAARIKAIDDELLKASDANWWARGTTNFPDAGHGGMGRTGEASWRFMRMPIVKWQSGPFRKQIAEIGAAVRRGVRDNPLASRFLEGWWVSQTSGMVGRLRQLVGFGRSGYQTMLNQLDLAQKSYGQHVVRENIERVQGVFADASDETKASLLKLVHKAYDYAGQAVGQGITDPSQYYAAIRQATADAMNDPIVRSVIPADQWDATIDLWAKMKGLTDDWYHTEQMLAAEGIIESSGYIENYMPIAFHTAGGNRPSTVFARGGQRPRPLKRRKGAFDQHRAAEVESMGAMFGIGRDQAEAIMDLNHAKLITDPVALLTGRAIAHGKILARANMLRQLKPLGLDINDLSRPMSNVASIAEPAGQTTFRTIPGDEARKAVIAAYQKGDLADIGLRGIDREKFFAGNVYDADVAAMIDRTVNVTQGQGLHIFKKLARGYADWYKSILTLRPGFHVRNLLSNFVLIYLRKGAMAFNPRMIAAGFAGAVKELGGRSAGVANSSVVRNSLQMRIGEYTVEELAEIATEKGVISRITMVGDIDDPFSDAIMKQRSPANPLRIQRKVFDFSKNTGTLIESSQRFSMFLMNVQEMSQRGLRLTDGEMDFAVFDARKWLVDYQNLTQFEQDVLRYMRPFYTWWRRSVPLMIEGIIDAPDLYASVAKGHEAVFDTLSGDQEFNREDMPWWMREMGYGVFGGSEYLPDWMGEEKPGSIVGFNVGLPFAGFNEFGFTAPPEGGLSLPAFSIREFVSDFAKSAHPAIASGVEIAANRDLFFDRELTGFRHAPRALRSLKAAPGLLQTLDGIARQAGSRRGMGFTDERGVPREDRRGRLQMDASMAKVLERWVPVLDWIGRALDGPEQLSRLAGLRIEEALDEANLGRDDHDNLDEVLRILSFNLGIAGYQYNPQQTRYWRLRELRDQRRQERNPFGGRQRIRAPEAAPLPGR